VFGTHRLSPPRRLERGILLVGHLLGHAVREVVLKSKLADVVRVEDPTDLSGGRRASERLMISNAWRWDEIPPTYQALGWRPYYGHTAIEDDDVVNFVLLQLAVQ
jgi:hypothetical protein